MRNLLFAATSAAVLGVAATAAAAPNTWKIDPVHSAVTFKIKHMMVSDARGTFMGLDGKATMDPADPTKGSVEASIDLNTVSTGEPKRDAHLKSPDFFDVAKNPKATFKSKKVTKEGKGYKIVGDLTLRGKTKEVTLLSDISAPVKGMDGKQLVGVHAETTINRKDFDVSWNKHLDKGGLALGNDVQLSIDIELQQDDGKTT